MIQLLNGSIIQLYYLYISTHTKVFTHLYFFNLLVYNYIIVSFLSFQMRPKIN